MQNLTQRLHGPERCVHPNHPTSHHPTLQEHIILHLLHLETGGGGHNQSPGGRSSLTSTESGEPWPGCLSWTRNHPDINTTSVIYYLSWLHLTIKP